MAKRYTDSEKWKKPFIRGLQGAYKLLWFYILDDCDHAGIYQVDLAVAAIRIGEKIDEEEAIRQFADKIVLMDNGTKWFIPSFIEFQYKELNPTNKAHASALALLKKNGIDANKLYGSPLREAKDKDKVSDKVKDKELLEKIKADFYSDSDLDAAVIKDNKLTHAQLATAKDKFWVERLFDPETLTKEYSEIRKHFIRWCRTKKQDFFEALDLPAKKEKTDEDFF